MNKKDLLRSIAEKGYDVGFGAKKHFATYDIIEKAPGLISFLSMAFGVISLATSFSSARLYFAIFIILGVCGLYISLYDSVKSEYDAKGKELTAYYSALKKLYFEVKSLEDSDDFKAYENELSEIEDKFYSAAISKQILFSNWYAHYKFFWEQQIGWVAEEKKFGLLRDKVPLSLTATVVSVVVLVCVWISDLISIACEAFQSVGALS